MPRPAAKEGDIIQATDVHMVQGAPFSTPFLGPLQGDLSADVLIEGAFAARSGSWATNASPHVPPPGKAFDSAPINEATVVSCAGQRVLVNGRPIARADDGAMTCHDLGLVVGAVIADGTVLVGE